jgi:hypothetical protein
MSDMTPEAQIRQKLKRSAASDIGSCSPVKRNTRVYNKCGKSLLDFGYTYFPHWVHRGRSPVITEYVTRLSLVITERTRLAIAIPRGYAKTTWAKIALMWAALYDYVDFSLVLAANQTAASRILSDIVNQLCSNELLLRDHPAACKPLKLLEGHHQRAPSQNIAGEHTRIVLNSDTLVMPTVTNAKSSGNIIRAMGITANFLGLNIDGVRPGFALLDDVQGLDAASSTTEVDKLESVVQGGVNGLASHEDGIGILMACTVAHEGDLSSRYTDKKLHPEFDSIRTGLVKHWPRNKDLWDNYLKLWKMESEGPRAATKFYKENREAMDAGAVVLDPDLKTNSELSALQHVYNLVAIMGFSAFTKQMQNQPYSGNASYNLTPGLACQRINTVPRRTLPPGHQTVVIGADINHDAIRAVVLGVSQTGSLAVVEALKLPGGSRQLVAKNATDAERNTGVYQGCLAVAEAVRGLGLKSERQPVVRGIALDRGYLPSVVHLAATNTRTGVPIIPVRGFSSDQYRPGQGLIGEPGYLCHMTAAKTGGQYLALSSCGCREYCQRALLAQPLTPGSLSFWGQDSREIYDLAESCAGPRLAQKWLHKTGTWHYRWEDHGEDHWLDAIIYATSLAFWFRLMPSVQQDVKETPVVNLHGNPAHRKPPAKRKPRRVPKVQIQ